MSVECCGGVRSFHSPTDKTFVCCEQVLSGISSLRVLGDFTDWYESVALDSVQIKNTVAQAMFGVQKYSESLIRRRTWRIK